MNLKDNISHWRALPPEEKLRRRWLAIPRNVALSMAFERESVPVERIREIISMLSPFQGSPGELTVSQSSALAQVEPPAMLKPRSAP